MINSENFNVISFLQDRAINISYEGKNVRRGWIGIQCLFCDDHSNHLGINLQSKCGMCLRCRTKINPFLLVRTIDNCSNAEVFKTLKEYSNFSIIETPKPKPVIHPKSLTFPFGIEKNLLDIHRQYLLNRGFSPNYLIKKYQLRAGHEIGDYKFRIIIPIIKNGQFVAFSGRDITGKSNERYKFSKKEESVIDPKFCLYNLDNARKKRVLVVEGAFVVWKIGDGCIATNGTTYTLSQALSLKEQKIEEVFILFDKEPDAQRLALSFGHLVSTFVKKVEILEPLIDKDYDDLTEDEVKEIRKELKL